VLDLVATTLLAPALVGAATLVSRRFGPRPGGIVSAFPAIVGPVLLIDLIEHDAAFTANAAAGTLLGLVALSAFVAVYGRLAPLRAWPGALAAAWGAAAAVGTALAGVVMGPVVAALAAAASLGLAARVLPAAPEPAQARVGSAGRVDLLARMGASVALVVALAATADAVGAFAGGVVAALPILASVLAVFTHRQEGGRAAVLLLRGMLGGMAGFLIFCLLVAVLIQTAGPIRAFAAGTAGAIAAQVLAAIRTRQRPLPT
jgi:hypothetical protein